jgi:hypothetical protein
MKVFILVLLLLVLAGCQDNERLARLEKENEALKAQLQDKNKVRDYDLEVRCSKDAKAWFREGFSSDKDTTMLILTNHYQANTNQCMAFIEEHSRQLQGNPGLMRCRFITFMKTRELPDTWRSTS